MGDVKRLRLLAAALAASALRVQGPGRRGPIPIPAKLARKQARRRGPVPGSEKLGRFHR